MTKFKIILNCIRDCFIATLAIAGGSYVFLSLCNWSLNIGAWGGFSRFIFSITVIVVVLICREWIDDARTLIKRDSV